MSEKYLRPSSAYRWLNCSGSLLLEDQHKRFLDKAANNTAANEGTKKHTEAAQYLEKHGLEPLSGEANLSQDVVFYVESLKSIHDTLDLDTSNVHMDIEKKLSALIDGVEVGGTPDCIIYSDGKAAIIDLKTGLLPVSPYNDQLFFYAYLFSLGKKIDSFENWIIQPNHYEDDKRVQMLSYDISYLNNWFLNSEDKIKKILAKEYYFKDGAHCNFCPVKVFCPIYKQAGLEAKELLGKEVTAVNEEKEEIIKWLNLKNKIIKFIDAVEKLALNILIKGEDLSGFSLEPKKGKTKWKNSAQALEFFKNNYKDLDIFKDEKDCLKTITDIKKELKRQDIDLEILDDLVSKESKGVNIIKL